VISRPNDSQYRQYREQTIITGGTTINVAFSTNSRTPARPQRPVTSRESSWAACSYREPVPTYPSTTAVAADATLRGQQSEESDERVRPEKERSRSSFIKLPFSDDKKRSINSRKGHRAWLSPPPFLLLGLSPAAIPSTVPMEACGAHSAMPPT